jgi:DNA primase
MSGRIPDDAIQDVRGRINIVELVSERTSLRKRGRNYVGLCPFHAEDTPSFTVSEERGFFHCFGCGASGDAFAWLMRTEQLAFPEAVRHLATRVGVRLPEETAGHRPRGADDPLFVVTEAAVQYYVQGLWEGGGGAIARAYLEQRGVAVEVARRWTLGYAPGQGDALARFLRTRGLPVEAALAVGLVGRRSDGTLFDRFRGRVMFPIKDTSGRVCGFGGRALPGAPPDAPKYLNSADSAIYKKGRLVYGLFDQRDAIRTADRAVVVEGYLDVLALHQHGCGVAVAPLGTALTAEQLRAVRRYTDNVVACFDGDAAGARAAIRSFSIFVEAGLWGRAAFLPAGDDPDTYVRAQGAAAFERVLTDATPLLDVFLEGLLDPSEPSIARRVQAAREVGRLLRRVRNPWEYDVLARRAAERLGVGEELLREEAKGSKPTAEPMRPGVGMRAAGEALLVELMLTRPGARARVEREGGAALFDDSGWRVLAESVIALERDGADPSSVVERLPPEMRGRVAATLLREADGETETDRLLDDCLHFLRRRGERRRVRAAVEQIRAAEATGDEGRLQEGLRRWQTLHGKDGGPPDS